VAVLLPGADTGRVTALAEFLVITFGPLLLWGGCGAVAGAAIGYLVIGGWSSTIIAAAIGLILGAVIDLSRRPAE
jgi:tetrahydromethanopterin S-methyltransferase subunit C